MFSSLWTHLICMDNLYDPTDILLSYLVVHGIRLLRVLIYA